LIPTPNGNGTVALRAAKLPLRERIRRLLRSRPPLGTPPRRPLPERG
jgi:hypothetical protein